MPAYRDPSASGWRLRTALVGGACLLQLLAATTGCTGDAAGTVGLERTAIIYGADDRTELHQAAEELRAPLSAALVALMPARLLEPQPSFGTAPRLADEADYCPDERFQDQPSAALCSAVLVDWDLLLTAGHCVRVLPLDELRAVFGYYYRAPGELAVGAGAAYEVSEIVAERLDPAGPTPRLDYAWLRLRHAVAPPLAPLAIVRTPAITGQSLHVAGTTHGLPFKVDSAATVREAGAPAFVSFVADSDTGHGASGGVALDATLAVLGVLARGGDDWSDANGCVSSVRQPASAAREQFNYAGAALAGLCAEDKDSSSLCRADCGDTCRSLPPETSSGGCSTFNTAARPTPAWLVALLCIWMLFATGRVRRR